MAATSTGSSSAPADGRAVFTVLRFLEKTLREGQLTEESKESLEVAFECLQEVFSMSVSDPAVRETYKNIPPLEELVESLLTDAEKQEKAEKLKNEGNIKLKNAEYNSAISLYTQAIQLSPSVSPYYANRAAAYIKIDELQKALDDCKKAVELNPNYARAYGRMGFIYDKLSQPRQARESFQKAIELDPDNVEYKSGLEKLAEAPPPPPPSGAAAGAGPQLPFGAMPDPATLTGILNNPGFMNLASSVMTNPVFQNMASRIFNPPPPPPGAPRPEGGPAGSPAANLASMMPELAEMGRRMQENDPVAFENLRRSAAQFQATHEDQPAPKDKEEKH